LIITAIAVVVKVITIIKRGAASTTITTIIIQTMIILTTLIIIIIIIIIIINIIIFLYKKNINPRYNTTLSKCIVLLTFFNFKQLNKNFLITTMDPPKNNSMTT
jgi:hypothetical protein